MSESVEDQVAPENSPAPNHFNNQNFNNHQQNHQNKNNHTQQNQTRHAAMEQDSDDDTQPQQQFRNMTEMNEEPTRYSRTRGASVRLSATMRQLTRKQIQDQLALTTINSHVSVTWAKGPQWNESAINGMIIAIQGPNRLIKTDNGIFNIPPLDSQTVITAITVTRKAVLNVPVNLSNGNILSDSATIFVDGGSRPNPGASGSAILVRTLATNVASTNFNEVSHSKYFAMATNNIAESIAMLAALRLAARMLSANETSHLNIVGDSELVYKTLLGIAKCNDLKIVPIMEMARETFMTIAGRVTIHTMRREHGNPADDIVKKCIQHGQGQGDVNLFIDPPLLPQIPTVSVQKQQLQAPALPHSIFVIPKTLSEFAQLRRTPARQRIPSTLIPLWTAILHHYLQMFAVAKSNAEREQTAIRILMLPHRFLPVRASVNRIFRHMSACDPFQIGENNGESTRQNRERHRAAEAINRLVADHKLRTANVLLQSVAEQEEMPYEMKLKTLQLKLTGSSVTTNTATFVRETIPFISAAEVRTALSRCNRQAATAIDGYTKDILMASIEDNAEIAGLLADFLHWIITSELSTFFCDIILSCRGIALPKPESELGRPICISSIFIKLLGIIMMTRDGVTPSQIQYAIGINDGHKRIVHKIRAHLRRKGSAVLRFDITNAFGSMPRELIKAILETRDKGLQQYFRLVYGQNTKVISYGPTQCDVIELNQGVKQGDSTSSLFFCLGLDKALSVISNTFAALNIDAKVYAYMDDITVCCMDQNSTEAANVVIRALNQIKLKVNEAKSKILSMESYVSSIPVLQHDAPFIILGANVAQSESAIDIFEKKMMEKQQKYFSYLNEVPLHSQVEFTLLKICGAPRILYTCEVQHPDEIANLTLAFDKNIKQRLEWLIDPSGEVNLTTDQIHSVEGLGFPAYTQNRTTLFSTTQHMALTDDLEPVRVPLTYSNPNTVSEAQVDSQWLFFEQRNHMTPAQFSTALSIRLNTLPTRLNLQSRKCNCGHLYSQQHMETIEHILRCDQATPCTHTVRHNQVRDSIIDTARNYGLTVSKEPTCLTYDNGRRQRPDILCHTAPQGVVTDVTLIHSDADIPAAEISKTKIHATATSKINCTFIPFVMKTRGTIGSKAEQFIRTLAKAVIPNLQRAFIRDLHHSVATAAAQGRAQALTLAAQRAEWL